MEGSDPHGGLTLNTILRLNAARTIPLSRYEAEGCFDRFGYLRGLAEENGARLADVVLAADLLGPQEDFDGLVAMVEDMALLAGEGGGRAWPPVTSPPLAHEHRHGAKAAAEKCRPIRPKTGLKMAVFLGICPSIL